MRVFSFAVFLLFTGAILAEDALDLVKQLKNSDNEERRKAAQKLFELKEEAKVVTPDMIAALKSEKDVYVKRFLIKALGAAKADPKTAVPILAMMIKDGDTKLVEAAIDSLGNMGSKGVEPLMNFIAPSKAADPKTKGKDEKKGGLKVDPSGDLIGKAAQSLGEIGADAKPAVPALIGALKNANARIDAANALGSIGTGAKEAIPKLQEIIEDKNTKRDKNYAKAVNDAMKKIQGNETVKKKKKE